MFNQKKKKKTKLMEYIISSYQLGGITNYPSVVCLKFNLLTCGFIFNALPTCASLRYYSITHLHFRHYSNTFVIKNKTQTRLNTPLSHHIKNKNPVLLWSTMQSKTQKKYFFKKRNNNRINKPDLKPTTNIQTS